MSNLLPPQQKKLVSRIRTARAISGTCFALMIVGIAALLLLMPTSREIKTHYDIAHASLSQAEANGSFVSQSDVAAATRTAGTLAQLISSKPQFSPVSAMRQIDAIRPSAIFIAQYSVNVTTAPVLEISGIATTRAALQSFVEALQKADGVKSVNSPVGNYVKNTNPSFTITVIFTQ